MLFNKRSDAELIKRKQKGIEKAQQENELKESKRVTQRDGGTTKDAQIVTLPQVLREGPSCTERYTKRVTQRDRGAMKDA